MQMRMGGVHIGLAIVALLVTAQTLNAADCGDTLTNKTGTVVSQDPGKGKNCTWYIISNNTAAQVMLDFEMLNLVAGSDSDNLTVFAGNDSSSKLIIFSVHQGPSMVIIPGNITKIVLTRGSSDTMTAQFTLSYNTEKCSKSVTGSQGVVTSPIYLNGTGAFQCTYNISVPGDVPVLSFPSFSLPDGDLQVKYNNATPQTLKGKVLPDDLVYGAGKANIVLTLEIKNASSIQSFTANYQTASSGCSGAFTADSNPVNISLPSLTPFSVTCYMKFTAKDNGSHVYMSTVTQSKLGGVDSVVFYDGGSVHGQQIGSVNQGLPWYVSSGQKMTAVAYLGSQTSRTAKLTYKQDKFSQLYVLDNKGTPAGPVTLKGTDVAGQTVSLQFIAAPVNGGQIQVSLGTSSKLTNSTVTIQDGQGNSLIAFGPSMAMFPVKVTGSQALVIISGLKGNDTVTLTASMATTDDCNQVYQGDSGIVTASASSTVVNATCTAAVTSAKATLFKMNSLSLCEGHAISVYAGLSSTAPKLATLSGSYSSLSQIYFPSGTAPRLSWNGTKAATGCSNPLLSANYWPQDTGATCGTLDASATSGSAQSANFPNQYPLNLGCTWKFPTQNNSLLYLSFKTIQLAEKHSVIVKNNKSNLVVLNSTVTSLPNDQILPNTNLTMTFSSAITNGKILEKTGSGFSLDYKVLSCGGFLTNVSANFSSPKVTSKSVECIWIVQVQPAGANKSVNVVSVNISTKGWVNASSGSLRLYDGGSVRDPVINVNLSSSKFTAYSRHNTLLISYTYNVLKGDSNLKAATPMSFNLTYTTYNCNSSSLCDNGDCMLPGWLCDGQIQCPDGSDELHCNCSGPVTTVAPPITPQPHTDNGKKVDGYWVFLCLVIGLVLGVLVTLIVPKIVRRWRLRNYANSASNYGSLHEDT